VNYGLGGRKYEWTCVTSPSNSFLRTRRCFHAPCRDGRSRRKCAGGKCAGLFEVDRDVHTAETRTPEEIAAQIKNKPKPQMQPEPENDMEIEHDPEPENNMDWLEMEI